MLGFTEKVALWNARLVLSKHRLLSLRITEQTSDFIAMGYQFEQYFG